ncbi:MAG: hypothetical protein NTX45_22875 [Proteobacteria bacterium]|nr:hypothetical protein [Pseudomonadota bacterium]
MKATGDKTINKKVLLIFAGLFVLVLGGEQMLPLLEELGMLAFEWVHKSLDFLYEDIIGLEDEVAKKASAWSGFLLLIGLIVWGCIKLYQQFQRMKSAMPQWWAETKAGLGCWWTALPGLQKVVFMILLIALVGVMAVII